MNGYLGFAYPNTFLDFYPSLADTELAEKYCSKFSIFVPLQVDLGWLTIAWR